MEIWIIRTKPPREILVGFLDVNRIDRVNSIISGGETQCHAVHIQQTQNTPGAFVELISIYGGFVYGC